MAFVFSFVFVTTRLGISPTIPSSSSFNETLTCINHRLEHYLFFILDSNDKMSPSNETNGTNGTKSGTVPLIIGGQEVFGPQTFTVTNPASGEEIWEAAGASVKEATQAVEAAAAAFPAWSKAKPAVRRDIFLKASQLFDERYEEFKGYQAAETGADPMFMHWILKLTVDNMKELAGKCSMVQGSIPFSADEGRSALVLREPYGVVVGIAP